MPNKSLLVSTFLVFSLGISSHAATMSSEAVETGIVEPTTAWDSTNSGGVQAQAPAYFSPADAETPTTAGSELLTIEEPKKKRKKAAILWTSSALALGAFFSSHSGSSLEVVPGDPLGPNPNEPSPDVAPVPELSSGLLVVLAFVGMTSVAIGRKQFGRSKAVRLQF